MTDKEDKNKKGWDEIFFGTIEKIAQAPGKLKDSKETVAAAFDWVKTVREDVQDKIVAEVSDRVSKIDWEAMGQRVGEHLVENFDIEIKTTVSFRPKKSKSKPKSSEPEGAE